MWGGIIVHSIPWLVTGWVVIITSRVNRDSACFHTPIPSVDSYLICFFYTKFLQISGCKHPTGHWVEFSHSLGRGRFWPNWGRSFWCGHSFLNSTEWLSRTSGDVNAQGGPEKPFSLFWSRSTGSGLCKLRQKRIPPGIPKGTNIKGRLKISIAQRSQSFFFCALCWKQQPPEKIQFLAVHSALQTHGCVLLHVSAHPSECSLPPHKIFGSCRRASLSTQIPLGCIRIDLGNHCYQIVPQQWPR